MRLSNFMALGLFAFGLFVMLAMSATQVRADPPSAEDLVACCRQLPTTDASTGQCGFFSGCVIIDGSPNSINRCKGIVLGCAEDAFACTPNTDGTKDCTCAQFVAACQANRD